MLGVNLAKFQDKLSKMSRVEIINEALNLYAENEKMNTKLAENEKVNTEMAIQYQQMRDELNAARYEIKVLREQNAHLAGVSSLRADELFGRSTETTEAILERVSEGNPESQDPIDEDGVEQNPEHRDDKGNPGKKSGGKGNGKHGGTGAGKTAGKRDRDLSKLPVSIDYQYDINELNEKYGEGGWRFVHWEKEIKVELVRPTTYVHCIYRPVVSVGLEHQLERPFPKSLFMPKSLATEGLVAQIMHDKFKMFLPTYRLEHDEMRYGFPLSRQTMTNWLSKATQEYLMPVFEYLGNMLKGYKYQQCDETPYTVIHDGRKAGSKSYIWAHRTSELSEGPQIIIFCYEKTRGADHLRNFYAGVTEPFYLTCDAYVGYSSFASDFGGIVILCGCFMHARRHFVEALKIIPTKGMSQEEIDALPESKMIRLIGAFYHEEGKLRNFSSKERFAERKADVKDCAIAVFDYARSFDLDDPALSDKMRDALKYLLNHEESLNRFLEDGNIPIDDGATERSIRPIAQGRRNYLFSNTVEGAVVTAVISTMIETAKANDADPYYYLKYLLQMMPQHIYDQDKSYLPDMMPWSDAFKEYEKKEKEAAVNCAAPPGKPKPQTPAKGKRRKSTKVA